MFLFDKKNPAHNQTVLLDFAVKRIGAWIAKTIGYTHDTIDMAILNQHTDVATSLVEKMEDESPGLCFEKVEGSAKPVPRKIFKALIKKLGTYLGDRKTGLGIPKTKKGTYF